MKNLVYQKSTTIIIIIIIFYTFMFELIYVYATYLFGTTGNSLTRIFARESIK